MSRPLEIHYWDQLPLSLTKSQVAKILQLSTQTITTMFNEGKLHGIKYSDQTICFDRDKLRQQLVGGGDSTQDKDTPTTVAMLEEIRRTRILLEQILSTNQLN